MRSIRSRSKRLAILLAGLLTVAAAVGCRRHYPPDPDHDVDIIASDGAVADLSIDIRDFRF